ncbi:hypothetical protein R3P38DRAFT_3336817 [Favolaschia claudopus]|uniref:K Homology domain-containing protein n=1 Tax=Favolaschia claudopus TaxID=2862362 RepID=A0AAV9Z4H8_9AGAR
MWTDSPHRLGSSLQFERKKQLPPIFNPLSGDSTARTSFDLGRIPQDLYSYCTLLRSELQRVQDRLDPPTPAIIAVGHTAIPLAETLPTAQDAPSRYSCTLVVPDSVVGHIVGRGGKGLHQSHDISGAQLRAYTDKASPLERRVSIRGTDQQIGEALIALGKRFMRKRIRSKKKGPSRLSGDPAPPPPGPVPVLPNASGEGARPLKKRAHPVHPSQPPAPCSAAPRCRYTAKEVWGAICTTGVFLPRLSLPTP